MAHLPACSYEVNNIFESAPRVRGWGLAGWRGEWQALPPGWEALPEPPPPSILIRPHPCSCPQSLLVSLQNQLSLLKVCRGTNCQVRNFISFISFVNALRSASRTHDGLSRQRPPHQHASRTPLACSCPANLAVRCLTMHVCMNSNLLAASTLKNINLAVHGLIMHGAHVFESNLLVTACR